MIQIDATVISVLSACCNDFGCRYSSHLLIQEDNEQVQKLNDSFRDGEVSTTGGGHAAADRSQKPKVGSIMNAHVCES